MINNIESLCNKIKECVKQMSVQRGSEYIPNKTGMKKKIEDIDT